MKIALLNAFPNLSHSAEREFIKRCIAVFPSLGHEGHEVYTSDEIYHFDPDVVFVTHEFVPKTTKYYTVGLLWSPPEFYKDQPDRIKAIRSWDLIAPINESVRHFAADIHFPSRHSSAVSRVNFFPSTAVNQLPFPNNAKLSLAYVGIHWDGFRHRRLFESLAQHVDLHVYGPPGAWEFLPNSYRGSIPFDGESVINILNQHGVVLAIHKQSHIDADTPSMRVFEACAAKCLVVTDPLPSLKQVFSDKLDYIESCGNPEKTARIIANILNQFSADPDSYQKRVRDIDETFRAHVSLDKLLRSLMDDVSGRLGRRPAPAREGESESGVTVVIRCGSRPLSFVQRAVSSVEKQYYKNISLIFARYAEIAGFDAWVSTLEKTGRFNSIRDLACRGGGVRSSSMWDGMRAVRTELFCMLDDDDELFPNHISDLAEFLRVNPGAPFVYSGVVRHEEDGFLLNDHVRFRGDILSEIRETRTLEFFDDFDLDRLLRFDNYIQSNAWMARREVLTADILDDPELEVQEDIYFYLLLASRYSLRFSGSVSAVWNWRSRGSLNSMTSVSQSRWEKTGARIQRRLANLSIRDGYLGRNVVNRGRLVERPGPGASLPEKHAPASTRDLAADFTIDFSEAQFPSFITDEHGFSGPEEWGRWSMGPELRLRFRSPLAKRIWLELRGYAFITNRGKPMIVSVGSTEVTLLMDTDPGEKPYVVELANDENSDEIKIKVPAPESPAVIWPDHSTDKRKLGIALFRLSVFDSEYVEVPRPELSFEYVSNGSLGDPLTQVRAEADLLYRLLLNRSAEPREIDQYSAALRDRIAFDQIAKSLLTKEEARRTRPFSSAPGKDAFGDLTNLIHLVFQRCLGRGPDSEALKWYQQLLAEGTSAERFIELVAGSDEAQARKASGNFATRT